MSNTIKIFLLIYFALISVVAIVLTVYDKNAAKKGRRRISERLLMWVAVLGGSAAMYFTMIASHHKTKKTKFMAGIPLIVLFEVASVLILINRLLY